MGYYLGVELNLPVCNRVKCPDGECESCKKDYKILSDLLLKPTSEDDRDAVRREHVSTGIYSFFSHDDYDRLSASKSRVACSNYLPININDVYDTIESQKPTSEVDETTEIENKNENE